MNMNQIELLRVLYENGFNLSKAADRMHVVQSAVSRQLQLFEEELGSPLLTRHGKKLTGLTPLGQKVLAQTQTMQQAKKNILSIASEYKNGDTGILHIATTHTQAKYFLPKPIRRFRDKYPKVKVYIVQSSPEHLIDFLHNGEADLAICTEKVSEDGTLVVKPCYEWHHAVVMPKQHPLASGELTLERLASCPVLTYSFGFTGRSNIEKAFENSGLTLDVVLAAADTDVIKTYVRLGLGVGLIAEMAYDAVADADLVVRNLSSLIPSSVTKIAYLRQNYLPAYGRHFIEELLEAAEDINFQ
ncbi:LysR substrate-binding domain-containing protein [Methylomarinum sp. Ch1-1]|uniref:LysR substrate-binding domain-containing protein n=1 Tax=Methylomarinum roseum TaxID=3067653 RepID=A0AAU7NQW6_9GAMM|nr:LysR substrate-binding domain-containing protein [Methylomarinum sp. Ch1-1]MDP4520663.1 LysR substrate-binding domain-containing protein [Methylomarinum sp. Ch1-1]